jgi:hypothetical protein
MYKKMKINKSLGFVALISLVICFSSFRKTTICENEADFSFFVKKTTNSWQESDMYGNSTSPAYNSDNVFTVYVDWNTNNGYCIVKNIQTKEQYRIDGSIYSNMAKGLKVYYLQENAGKCKLSFTKEENGAAVYTYSSKTLTIFFNR